MTAEPIHIATRGRNGRRLFSYPRDYRAYILCLSRAAARTGCHIHAACLTTERVHLLLTPREEGAVSALLAAANRPYTVLRNASRNAGGNLFERSFWSSLMDSADGIGATTAHIENIPVRHAGAASAGAYRWSTHRLSTGAGDSEPEWQKVWTPSSWYESLGDSPEARAARYRQFFAATEHGLLVECPDELEHVEPQRRRIKGS